MELNEILKLLDEKTSLLHQSLPVVWRHPKTAPKNPLKTLPKKSWSEWNPQHSASLRKNAKNWFYGEVVFPETKDGLPLRDAGGWFFINGWCPFTLWLDGKKIFRETHAWHATGPIGDPVIAKIEPGRKYNLILCLEPTELPAGFNPVNISVNAKTAVHTAVDVAAAAAQLRFADAISTGRKQKDLIAKAASKLDVKALSQNDWKKFFESAAAMEATLQPLSAAAKDTIVHLIGHTHIDMDWMWTWKDTVHCAATSNPSPI